MVLYIPTRPILIDSCMSCLHASVCFHKCRAMEVDCSYFALGMSHVKSPSIAIISPRTPHFIVYISSNSSLLPRSHCLSYLSNDPSSPVQPRPAYSFTTFNSPLPPLFRSIPFVPGPACCLLFSLKCPLSISCLPPARTRSLCACCSGLAWKRRSTLLLRVPRRVSPTPCC